MSQAIEANLETFILLPLQISKKTEKTDFDPEAFREHLERHAWQLKDHAPDRISASGLNELDIKHLRYQAYNYFHPFVRHFWFDNELVQRFRHPKLHRVCTCIKGIRVEFDAVCDLIHFAPDIVILSLHLKSQGSLPIAQIQNCLDQLRRIYPPYIQRDDKKGGHYQGGHYPDEVSLYDDQSQKIAYFQSDEDTLAKLVDQGLAREAQEKRKDKANHEHIVAPHWQYLLTALSDEYIPLQLGDDRATLSSQISIIDPSWSADTLNRGDMIRLCFADPSGNDRLPYAKSYLEQFETRFCYDRFWYAPGESSDAPSRIMNCGYAFTWLGSAKDEYYFANAQDGATATFRQIYTPMATIALFQKAALMASARKLADLDENEKKTYDQECHAIKSQFLNFSRDFWFTEITPQEQGCALYDMWGREFRLQEHYKETREKIHDLVDDLELQTSKGQANSALHLNKIAGWFGLFSLLLTIIGLVFGALGMNTFEYQGKLDLTYSDNSNDLVQFLVSQLGWVITAQFAIFFVLCWIFLRSQRKP